MQRIEQRFERMLSRRLDGPAAGLGRAAQLAATKLRSGGVHPARAGGRIKQRARNALPGALRLWHAVQLARGRLHVGGERLQLAGGKLSPQPAREPLGFLTARHCLDGMRDRLRRSAAATDLHEPRLVEEFLRQRQHFARHRRREEQRLPLLGQCGEDAPHVGPEAHVEHPIRLIEHQDFEAAHIHRVMAHVIHQATGCRDNDVYAGTQGALLHVHRHAAIDGHARNGRVIGKALNLILNLNRELACWSEDQRARALRIAAQVVLRHARAVTLAEQVDPKNEQERVLADLWNVASEEEQHAIANMMVKLVQSR